MNRIENDRVWVFTKKPPVRRLLAKGGPIQNNALRRYFKSTSVQAYLR
jgi:hypothetical protein